MVAVLIEAFGWALPTMVFLGGGGMPWSEVVKQSPCAAMLVASFKGTVQVLAIVKIPVHRAHQPIKHVAGAVTARVFIRERPQIAFLIEVEDLRKQGTAPSRPPR